MRGWGGQQRRRRDPAPREGQYTAQLPVLVQLLLSFSQEQLSNAQKLESVTCLTWSGDGAQTGTGQLQAQGPPPPAQTPGPFADPGQPPRSRTRAAICSLPDLANDAHVAPWLISTGRCNAARAGHPWAAVGSGDRSWGPSAPRDKRFAHCSPLQSCLKAAEQWGRASPSSSPSAPGGPRALQELPSSRGPAQPARSHALPLHPPSLHLSSSRRGTRRARRGGRRWGKNARFGV